jgi:hypothetical protein
MLASSQSIPAKPIPVANESFDQCPGRSSSGEPGFHPEARHEFKVHFDGADFETLTYRVSFAGPDADGGQARRRADV